MEMRKSPMAVGGQRVGVNSQSTEDLRAEKILRVILQ